MEQILILWMVRSEQEAKDPSRVAACPRDEIGNRRRSRIRRDLGGKSRSSGEQKRVGLGLEGAGRGGKIEGEKEKKGEERGGDDEGAGGFGML